MTHNSTRKQFFAKLLGVTTAAGLCSNLSAQPAASQVSAASAPSSKRFEVRPDARSIARRSDSV